MTQEVIFKFVDGVKVPLANRDSEKRYALSSEGLRELSEAETVKRDAEEAEFSAKKAQQASEPKPMTLLERMIRVEEMLQKLTGGEK